MIIQDVKLMRCRLCLLNLFGFLINLSVVTNVMLDSHLYTDGFLHGVRRQYGLFTCEVFFPPLYSSDNLSNCWLADYTRVGHNCREISQSWPCCFWWKCCRELVDFWDGVWYFYCCSTPTNLQRQGLIFSSTSLDQKPLNESICLSMLLKCTNPEQTEQ